MALSCISFLVNWCSPFHLLVITWIHLASGLDRDWNPPLHHLLHLQFIPLGTCHLVALQLLSHHGWSGHWEAWQDPHEKIGLFAFGLSPSGLQLIAVNLHHTAKSWGKTLLNAACYYSFCLPEYGTGKHGSLYQSPVSRQALIFLRSIQHRVPKNVGWEQGDHRGKKGTSVGFHSLVKQTPIQSFLRDCSNVSL